MAILGLALLLAAAATPMEAAAQSAEAGWEIHVVLDGSRSLSRRVRMLLFREPGGELESPLLGTAFLGKIRDWDWVGDWPGLEPSWLALGPEPFVGMDRTAAPSSVALQTVEGREYERSEYVSVQETVWRLPGEPAPSMTVAFREDGPEVLSPKRPDFIPLLPRRLDLKSQGVLWALRHDESGKVVWALATGSVRGSSALTWQAHWRSEGAEGPAGFQDALGQIPDEVLGHAVKRYRPFVTWTPSRSATGALASIRYNEVQGGSIALPAWVNLTSTLQLRGWARVSTSSYPLTGGLGITLERWPATWGLEVYRRLEDANRWEPAERKRGNSLMAFLYGQDDGHYYTAEGGSVWGERNWGLNTWRVEFFGETDRTARPRVTYSLFARDTLEVGPGLEAEDGDFYGARAAFEHQRGLMVQDGVLVTNLWIEATTGDRDYFKIGGIVDGLKSWGSWAVGARAGGGWILGDAPVQRGYFLGGTTTVRGLDPATLEGTAMALGRLEVGFGPPGSRIVGFGDVGWAGEDGSLVRGASAGIGLSLMEGVIRLDLAKVLEGGTGIKFFISGNGLL